MTDQTHPAGHALETDRMSDRIPLDHLTSDQYDQLCADLDRADGVIGELNDMNIRMARDLAALRQVARGYCPACGRGDAAPTVADWEQQRQRANRAMYAIGRVRALADDMRGSSDTRWLADQLDKALTAEQTSDTDLQQRIAEAIRRAACDGTCSQAEDECARERIQPFAWHHGTLAVVEGSPEQFAAAALAAVQPELDARATRAEQAAPVDAHELQAAVDRVTTYAQQCIAAGDTGPGVELGRLLLRLVDGAEPAHTTGTGQESPRV